MKQENEKNLRNEEEDKKNNEALMDDELTVEELKDTSGGQSVLMGRTDKFQ